MEIRAKSFITKVDETLHTGEIVSVKGIICKICSISLVGQSFSLLLEPANDDQIARFKEDFRKELKTEAEKIEEEISDVKDAV